MNPMNIAPVPVSPEPKPEPVVGRADESEPTAVQLTLDFLGRRFSVGPKYLVQPAPTAGELFQAACVSLRAPDHGNLQPFRFVQVLDHQREYLGDLFAADAARRGQTLTEVERARARAGNGPALLALIGSLRTAVPDVPVHEQWLCIGGGLMNFLNALHLQGYGAKTLSGASIDCPEIQAAFCERGERLLAWIVVGTPVGTTHAKRIDDASKVLTDWSACGEAKDGRTRAVKGDC